jgi:hypothetical protein
MGIEHTREAELVVKIRLIVDARGETEQVRPELCLMGNAEGFAFLENICRHMQQLSKSVGRESFRFLWDEAPFVTERSDAVAVFFGVYDAQNRTTALEDWRATADERAHTDVGTWFPAMERKASGEKRDVFAYLMGSGDVRSEDETRTPEQ